MQLFSDQLSRLGSENAFKLGVNIQECLDKGIDVIRFNIGEPDFDTAPYICEEAIKQINGGNTHYCPPQGLLSLRKAIAKQVSETRKVPVDPDRVIVTTGGKPPIPFTMMAYLNPGDEVIYPSPGFPIYESWINYVGAKPVPLHLKEENNFSFNQDDLDKLITPKTKLIIINSPSNPTGGVLSDDDLKGIADVIKRRCHPNVRIYSDEIYEHILFDGAKHRSIASYGLENQTLIAGGHSKTYAMTGWRLGYVVLPTREEAEAFKNLNINVTSCTAPFIQEAGRVALESPETAKSVAHMVSKFQERRNYAVPALNAIPGIHCNNPVGAFYLFPNIGKVLESFAVYTLMDQIPENLRKKTNPVKLFQMFLLYRHGVATLDRNSFGSIGTEGQHFLRISIATSMDNIKKGIERIARAAADRQGFEDFVKEGKNLF